MKKEGILSVLLVIAVIFGVVSYSNNRDSQAEIARLEKQLAEEVKLFEDDVVRLEGEVTQEKEASYSEGYMDGFESGFDSGYDSGLEEGWNTCEHGWPRALAACGICDVTTTVDGESLTGDARKYYNSGYNDGYDAGYEDRYESAQKYSGYELGYEDGYNDGYEWGRESIYDEYGHPEDIYARGYDEGFDEGYNDGYEDGRDSDY